MPDIDKPESMLVADIGSVSTKVALVERVGTEYRFVGAGISATTAEPPASDILVGVRDAIQQIEAQTGRRLLNEEAQLIKPERASGQGVDGFAAITSAPLPLRVAIVGLSREVSVASAALAATGTYATVEATLALDETGGRWMRAGAADDGPNRRGPAAAPPLDPAVVAAEALAQTDPDVIVLVGGVEGGATTGLYELANLVAAITAAREEGARPTIVFAGNHQARPEIAARVGQAAPLRVVDNVHPALDRENLGPLQRELEALYVERKIARLPGVSGLNNWVREPILPTARAFENVVRYLAHRYDLRVVGVDIGGTCTTVCTAQAESYSRRVRPDVGVGRSLEKMIAQVGIDALLGWLPFEWNAEEALARYYNDAARPNTIPMTREDARARQGAARQALLLAAEQSQFDPRAVDLILLSGGALAHNSDYGGLALIALDALQPHGVFTIAVDTLGLAPAFGALASLNPEAAAGVLERDGFVTLGSVIAPVSSNRDEQIDLRVQIQPEGSGMMNLEVEHGSLEVVPLAPGQKASLEVRPAAGVDLGPARGGVFKADIEGGAIGLIIDARGRPVVLPPIGEKRREKVQKWLWDVGS